MRTRTVRYIPNSTGGRAKRAAISFGLAAVGTATFFAPVPHHPQVPTPESVLGQRVGADFFNAALYGSGMAAAAPSNPGFREVPEEEEERKEGGKRERPPNE